MKPTLGFCAVGDMLQNRSRPGTFQKSVSLLQASRTCPVTGAVIGSDSHQGCRQRISGFPIDLSWPSRSAPPGASQHLLTRSRNADGTAAGAWANPAACSPASGPPPAQESLGIPAAASWALQRPCLQCVCSSTPRTPSIAGISIAGERFCGPLVGLVGAG